MGKRELIKIGKQVNLTKRNSVSSSSFSVQLDRTDLPGDPWTTGD